MLHEALVTLFTNRLALAPELLRDALGVAVPAFTSLRREAADLTQILPTEYRADHVVVLDRRDRPVLAIVVEVQLRPDESKRSTWPLYLAALRARLRCPVLLLVVTTRARVAAWARRPIALGHPGFELTPLVLGPATVPRVTDPDVARAAPELAVLSAMAHATDPLDDAVRIAKAALDAVGSLDEERAELYADLVLAALGGAAKAALEAYVMSGKYEYQSDFARKYFGLGKAEGKVEGKAEGKAEGRAEALLVLLVARGLVLTADQRELILHQATSPKLDAWIARAVTAHSVAELLDGEVERSKS